MNLNSVINSETFKTRTQTVKEPTANQDQLLCICTVFMDQLRCINSFENEFQPFRPIISGIRTITYKLLRFLVPILTDKTQNKFTEKGPFTFANEIST